MSRRQSFRTLSLLARDYDLKFEGVTGKGHLRWRHQPTGKSVVTVSLLSGQHSLQNTIRDIKKYIGVSNGQHDSAD